MTFERIFDMDLIRRTMTHPQIWPHISDDGAPSLEGFEPPSHPSIWYVAVRSGSEFMGLWMFVPQSAVCFEVHTCLLPTAWGTFSRRAAVAVADWMWQQCVNLQRIVTSVPECNRLALRLAENSGMLRYGLNPMSYLKNGKLYGQILLGISREEPCQQQ